MTAKTVLPVLLLLWATTALGDTYNPSGNFSTTDNPNGTWSYGYSLTLGGPLILFPQFGVILGSQLSGWTNPDINALSVANNSTALDIPVGGATLPPGDIWYHPGPSGEYAVLRWTAPLAVAATIDVSGFFVGIDRFPTTTDAHILLNGTSLFDTAITTFGTASQFDLPLAVAPGDTLDFAVGYGNGSYVGDPTGLQATITETPEPGTTGLLTVIGCVGLILRNLGSLVRKT